MEVVVVGMVTAATPQQEEHTPTTDRVSDTDFEKDLLRVLFSTNPNS